MMKTTEKFSKRIRPLMAAKDLVGTTPKIEQNASQRRSLKPMKSMVGLKSSRPMSITERLQAKKNR